MKPVAVTTAVLAVVCFGFAGLGVANAVTHDGPCTNEFAYVSGPLEPGSAIDRNVTAYPALSDEVQRAFRRAMNDGGHVRVSETVADRISGIQVVRYRNETYELRQSHYDGIGSDPCQPGPYELFAGVIGLFFAGTAHLCNQY